jgi:hypothetical protein
MAQATKKINVMTVLDELTTAKTTLRNLRTTGRGSHNMSHIIRSLESSMRQYPGHDVERPEEVPNPSPAALEAWMEEQYYGDVVASYYDRSEEEFEFHN